MAAIVLTRLKINLIVIIPPFARCAQWILLRIWNILILCPYLDGARLYALLLWKNQLSNIVYNLFYSAILYWPNNKLTQLLLDPMSQFQYSDISPHPNLEINMNNFVQDFTYSLHRQQQIFYGEWSGTWCNHEWILTSIHLFQCHNSS